MISIRDIFKAKAAGDRVLLNEMSLKRVLVRQAQSVSPTWAMVTADRLDATEAGNSSSRSALNQRVRSLGYGTTGLNGLWTIEPGSITGSQPVSRFVQRAFFIHGITLTHLQRLTKSFGQVKALFGSLLDNKVALIEPGGFTRGVAEVSPVSITKVWGANWCPGWTFEGFGLPPQSFIENLIEKNLRSITG